MITKKRLTKQMMTLICSVTLAACGQAPTVQTNSEYEVMGIANDLLSEYPWTTRYRHLSAGIRFPD